MTIATLKTAQLQLLPFSPAHLLAILESVEQFNTAFGIPAADGLREFYTSGEISPAWLDLLKSSTETNFWLHGFAVVHRAENLVIGTAGFKGPPNETGTVEIAYGIVPSYQARGYATEAAAALTKFAYQNPGVQHVIAHTLPAENASTRVLTKCGFKHAGNAIDPEDGPVWRWER